MEFLWFYLCLSVILGGCSTQLTTSSDGLGSFRLPAPQPATTAVVVGAAAPTTMSTALSAENQTTTAPLSTPTRQVQNADSPSANNTSKSASEATASPANATEFSTPGVNLTATSPVVSMTHSTRKRTTTNIVRRKITTNTSLVLQSLDSTFVYDDSSIRHVGLGLAAIFFVTGILVLACERLSLVPKCHVSSGKTYEVTRV